GRALGRWRVNSTNSSDEYCSLPQSEIRNQQISPQLFSLFTDPPDGFDSQLSTNCHAVDSRVGGPAIPADHGSLATSHYPLRLWRFFVSGRFFLRHRFLGDDGFWEEHDPGVSLGGSILTDGRLERQFSVSDLG